VIRHVVLADAAAETTPDRGPFPFRRKAARRGTAPTAAPPLVSSILTAGVLLIALATSAGACPYSIHDAGFIVRDVSPYHLYLCLASDTPGREDLRTRFRRAAGTYLLDSNVAGEVVNVHDLPTHEAARHLKAMGKVDLPAVLLVSPRGEALRLPGPGVSLASDESCEAMMRDVVSSPAVEKLRAHLVDRWCAIVVDAASCSPSERERAAKTAQAAAQRAVGITTEMAQSIDKPPFVLLLEGGPQARGEAVLRWSLGIGESAPTSPVAAVVFGAGRRLGPLIRGAALTEQALLDDIAVLGRNCTCTSDPTDVIGPTIPMVWDAKTRARAAKALGFDPESPDALMTLSGVWRTPLARGGGEFSRSGYTEAVVELGPEPPTTTAETVNPARPVGNAKTRVGRYLVIAVAALALVAAALGALILLRRR